MPRLSKRWTIAALGAVALLGLACDDDEPLRIDPVDGAAPTPADDAADLDAAARDAADDTDDARATQSSDGAPTPSPALLAAKRAACGFGRGAHVAETLGPAAPSPARIPIKHIIVMMKENRAFDHILGRLHDAGQPGTEAPPADFANLDLSNQSVPFFHAPTTCWLSDPGHQWAEMHAQIDGGKMDGYVASAAQTSASDGHFVMSYNDEQDLPFYYWLASTFALADRHFPAARSGTFPNRNFLLLGTADGVQSTGAGLPNPRTPTIFDLLDAKGISWGAFTDSEYFDGALGWERGHRGTHSFGAFVVGLERGTLPAVSFVDSVAYVEDEHPTADLERGEAWSRDVYTHVVASPLWPETALIWTYDEAGGFADHVPPPEHACVARPGPTDAPFFELGTRVPLVMISPWARAHAVSHQIEDHTAITRFIEAVFDLPALTARDANSTALFELLDFDNPPALLQPPLAPAAGTGHCAAGVQLSVARHAYNAGDPIQIMFTNGPATDAGDRIAIYLNQPGAPTPATADPLLAAYVGGGNAPTVARSSGTVTIDVASVVAGKWPLAPGLYYVYYLPNQSKVPTATIDIEIRGRS